jgi:hypothetical protein
MTNPSEPCLVVEIHNSLEAPTKAQVSPAGRKSLPMGSRPALPHKFLKLRRLPIFTDKTAPQGPVPVPNLPNLALHQNGNCAERLNEVGIPKRKGERLNQANPGKNSG